MADEDAAVEALRAEIEVTRAQVQAETAKNEERRAQLAEATARQKLRRELDEQRMWLLREQRRGRGLESETKRVDEDKDGDYQLQRGGFGQFQGNRRYGTHEGGEQVSCARKIYTEEFVWEIQGFSWLNGVLDYERESFVWSNFFCVGYAKFYLVYNPFGDELWNQRHGSFAIVCHSGNCSRFRYSVFVKARSRMFKAWGETSEGTFLPDSVHGPDVFHSQGPSAPAAGIFGLSHRQLLQSDWVQDDMLTLKVLVSQ
ncbi:BPM1 [Symbiodinium necroappetens]|uniref:BPM1 protein n=1 Tax=Symbiodinium necroappetens TaxID=1628268 RepID=A0A813C076_9DINO|nr:BPM1 [Symbiodinium necroappetens]